MESKLVEKTIQDIKKCLENVSMLMDKSYLIQDAISSEKNKIKELAEKAPVIYAITQDEICETIFGYDYGTKRSSGGEILVPIVFKPGTELMFTMSHWGEYWYYQEEDNDNYDSYVSFSFDKYKHILSISKIVQRKT